MPGFLDLFLIPFFWGGMRIHMSGYDNRVVFMDMLHVETNFRITKQGINRIHYVPPFGVHMIDIIRYTLRISG